MNRQTPVDTGIDLRKILRKTLAFILAKDHQTAPNNQGDSSSTFAWLPEKQIPSVLDANPHPQTSDVTCK